MPNRLLLLSLILLLSIATLGCGGDAQSFVLQNPGDANAPVALQLVAATGSTLTHPATGHSVQIGANGVTGDTQATLSLLTQGLPTPAHPEFLVAGTAIQLDLGNQRLVGTATVFVPFQTSQPASHRLYWLLPGGFYFPLDTTFDPTTSTFTAQLPQSVLANVNPQTTQLSTHSQVTVGLINEATFLARPDHVDWPSYNLYSFENGAFQKVIDQGQVIGTLPTPGSRPLMVVHGLGSNIPNFDSTVTALPAGDFTSVVGFEYDTLSALSTTGPRLRQAYNLLEGTAGRDWHHLAHSMGCLVSRQGFENGGSLPYNTNNVVFAAGPHLGSKIVNALQGSQSTFENFITALVINNIMDFKNADGTPCKVGLTDAGFNDLAEGSAALTALNTGAAGNHPKETYRTLGGNARGLAFDAVNALVGVFLDDGFVDIPSANATTIGAVESQSVPDNHLNITTDTPNGLRVIQEFLSRS